MGVLNRQAIEEYLRDGQLILNPRSKKTNRAWSRPHVITN